MIKRLYFLRLQRCNSDRYNGTGRKSTQRTKLPQVSNKISYGFYKALPLKKKMINYKFKHKPSLYIVNFTFNSPLK
jgi:hypothetical protein